MTQNFKGKTETDAISNTFDIFDVHFKYPQNILFSVIFKIITLKKKFPSLSLHIYEKEREN